MVTSSDLLEVIKRRRSVRDYTLECSISRDDLEKLIEAAMWAPSGANRQPWKFITVTSKDLIAGIADVVERKVKSSSDRYYNLNFDKYMENILFFKDASCLIIVLYRQTMSFLGSFDEAKDICEDINFQSILLSVGAAIQNIILTAHTMGLGTCWMTAPLIAKREIESLLNIAHPWNIASIIPVGKLAGCSEIKRKNKKAIWEERVHDK